MASLRHIEMKLIEFREAFRFVIAGAVSTVIDFAALIFFREVVFQDTAWGLACAVGLAYFSGICVHYVFSALYVFRRHETKGVAEHTKKFIGFVVTSLLGLVWNELGILILSHWLMLDYRFSKLIMTGVVMGWNYLIQRFVVFKRGRNLDNV